MSKLSHVALQLLGPFAIEANVGRPVPIAVRSRKARALLAYLAMQPDYRARREELATLLWGACPDKQARHSLRQCLIALRQDLSVASEILVLDRETIGLHAQSVSVDARSFIALARSTEPDAPSQAAQLWHGAFLPDLTLDIEEFDTWRRREADQLAAAAGEVFGALYRNADAKGDGMLADGFVEEGGRNGDYHILAVFAPFEFCFCPKEGDFAVFGRGEAVDGDLRGERDIRVGEVA